MPDERDTPKRKVLKQIILTYQSIEDDKALDEACGDWSAAKRSMLVIIDRKYSGNASNIWAGKPPSADVVYRFLELPGFGIKIATMAPNILARTFKVPFSNHYSIDTSPDRHVRRVFARLGLTREKAPDPELIYCARSLSPEFPGLLDSPTFEIERTWCKERAPICSECFMGGVCPPRTARSKRLFGNSV